MGAEIAAEKLKWSFIGEEDLAAGVRLIII